MKRLIVIIVILFASLVSKGQGYPNTDSLRTYNIKYITNNAATAFTNLRLHTLLRGIIDWIDTARAGTGGGGAIGIDTLYALNDSTIRYRKNGVFRNAILKGVYDTRRKVDTAYALNDSTLQIKINGTNRNIILPGRHWNLQGVLNNGSTLTENENIVLADSLEFTSGWVIIDSLRLRSLPQKSDTTAHKPIAVDASGNVVKMAGWPGGAVTWQQTLDNSATLTENETITLADSLKFTSGNVIIADTSIIYKALAVATGTVGAGNKLRVNGNAQFKNFRAGDIEFNDALITAGNTQGVTVLGLLNDSANTNERIWSLQLGQQEFTINTWNDAVNASGTVMKAIRSGVAVTDVLLYGQFGVNHNNPRITAEIFGRDAIAIPFGNTAQRPTGDTAFIRFNTDSLKIEYHTGAAWVSVGTGSGVSGVALDDIQTHTSGATVTVSNGKNVLYVDPGSTLAALTITLPATAHNGNEIQIYFGGTLTSGTVVTSLTISGNTGQSIIQATTPSSVDAGEAIVYKYRASTSTWYRKS